MTLARTIKMYKLPDVNQLPLVPMTEEDVPSALELISGYLEKYDACYYYNTE